MTRTLIALAALAVGALLARALLTRAFAALSTLSFLWATLAAFTAIWTRRGVFDNRSRIDRDNWCFNRGSLGDCLRFSYSNRCGYSN